MVRSWRIAETAVLPRAFGPLARGQRQALCRWWVARVAQLPLESVETVSFRNGSLIAFTSTHVIKIPVTSGSTAWREPAAWSLARAHGLSNHLVTGDVRTRGPALALVTPRYRVPAHAADAAAAATELLSALAARSSIAPLGSADLPELAHGIRAFHRFASAALAGKLAEEIGGLLREDARIGPMHGDLHAGNVVLSPEGPRLVDCGDFRMRGAHTLDAIVCAIEAVADAGSSSWAQVLSRVGHREPLKNFQIGVEIPGEAEWPWLRLFAVYRIGQISVSAPRDVAAIVRLLDGAPGFNPRV